MLTVLTQMPPFFSGNSEWTYGHPDGPSRRPFGISQGYFWVRVMSAPKKEVPIDHARASSHLARPRRARRQTCHPRDTTVCRIRDRTDGRRVERDRYPRE